MGASVLLGVDGSRGARRARARFFSRNAEVPTMIIAVGSAEAISRALVGLRELLRDLWGNTALARMHEGLKRLRLLWEADHV